MKKVYYEIVVQFNDEEYNVTKDERLYCGDCGLEFTADEFTAEDEDGNDLCPACGCHKKITFM